jgi:transcriptional regulator with XRE-family HTH domain
MPAPQNIVGSRIKSLRRDKGLTQAMLAARCGLLGWDIGENIITKIETRIRCITDVELVCLAKALDVNSESLLPPNEKSKSTVATFFRQRTSG